METRLLNVVILFLVFSTTFAFGQKNQNVLKLELLNRSDKTIDKPIHNHLFKVSNNSNSSQEFSIVITNTPCKNISKLEQDILKVNIYNKGLSNEIEDMVLNAGGSKEFYVKTTRKKNTKLDTWSCIEIKAVNNKAESNTVLFKSFTPDPNNEE